MNKKDDLLDNNDDKQKVTKPKQTRKKKTETIEAVKAAVKPTTKATKAVEDPYISPDDIVTVALYDEILSTLYNSLNNPIVRNEIKVNETILKYLELQISNLFLLEKELAEELANKKMAKEFLQLTANIMDLALSVSKSHKKTRIEILEDRNLLVVTIINSCKGVERESLEKNRSVSVADLQSLSDQIAALSNFTTEEKTTSEETNYNQEVPNTTRPMSAEANQINNPNMRDLNNMANLSKLGVLPEHPAGNPNFYPYLTKPAIVPKLKKVLSGLLIASSILVIVTLVISLFVKGPLLIDKNEEPKNFVLSQTNNWLILIMTVVLYASFGYMFLRPTKILREKYRISYFMLGLLLFWLIMTMGYYFWQISDSYYENFFKGKVKEENLPPGGVKEIVDNMKALPNFQIFRIFSITTGSFTILPLVLVLVLILINPRIDRKKIMRANVEYQNAVNAALSGQKYDIDPSLFDHDEVRPDKKNRKANFSGRF